MVVRSGIAWGVGLFDSQKGETEKRDGNQPQQTGSFIGSRKVGDCSCQETVHRACLGLRFYLLRREFATRGRSGEGSLGKAGDTLKPQGTSPEHTLNGNQYWCHSPWLENAVVQMGVSPVTATPTIHE